MLSTLRNVIRKTDSAAAGAYLSLFPERAGIVSLLFHTLFTGQDEIAQNLIHPTQYTTIEQFQSVLRYYRKLGHRFIRPADLLTGELDPRGRYALVSFDDGYFNNTRALPVMESLDVPVTFFIATENVRVGKGYWWDVHWRESSRRGMTTEQIVLDGRSLKSKTTEQIEAELARRFGAGACKPVGDLDRPFTPDELKQFASHPLVELGNHTSNHAILVNYTAAAAREQIALAQTALLEWTGRVPSAIAYPNGAHSPEVVSICMEAGLKLGFTVRPKKSTTSFRPGSQRAMRIGRFMPEGREPIEKQCKTFRSDLPIYATFHAGYEKLSQHRWKQAAEASMA